MAATRRGASNAKAQLHSDESGGPGRSDTGAATVELVLATPLLGLLLMMVVQFAVWAHASHIAQAAANEGLQSARLYHGSAAQGAADARDLLDQLAGTVLTDPAVTVTRDANSLIVTVTGAAASVLPGLRLPIRVRVAGPVEQTGGPP